MIIGELGKRDAKLLSELGECFQGQAVSGGDRDTLLTGVVEEWSGISDASGIPDGVRKRIISSINEVLLPGPPSRIAVRRYEKGSSSPPHKFHEEIPGNSRPEAWTVLCALQDSDVDAFTYWSGERFSRHFDSAGSGLHIAQNSWCWSSPVRAETRYTLAIGGGHRWKS